MFLLWEVLSVRFFVISVNSRLRNVLSPCNILQCVSAFVYMLNVCCAFASKLILMWQNVFRWNKVEEESPLEVSHKCRRKLKYWEKKTIYKRIHKNTSHTHNLGGIDKVFRWKNFDVRVIKVSYSFFVSQHLPPPPSACVFAVRLFVFHFVPFVVFFASSHSSGLSFVSGHFFPIDFGSKLHIECWLHTFTQRLS